MQIGTQREAGMRSDGVGNVSRDSGTSQSISVEPFTASLPSGERFPTGYAVYRTDSIRGGKKFCGVADSSNPDAKKYAEAVARRLDRLSAGVTGETHHIQWYCETRS